MKKCLIMLVVFVCIFSIYNYSIANEIDEETNYIWITEEIEGAYSKCVNELIIDSRYVCAFDRDSKTLLYGKDENKAVKMASTTKIMTAIVLIENMKSKGLEMNSEVEVCKTAANIQGSRLGLKEGDKISINDLLYGLMLCSRK